MYVLDTNVVSALRLPRRNLEVASWARVVPAREQYVTSITVTEIERGVVRRENKDPAQGAVLRRWFTDKVLPEFSDRILPFDLRSARVFAHYPVPESAPHDDALIAAIADSRSMTVVTRNIAHFRPLGVRTINPWG